MKIFRRFYFSSALRRMSVLAGHTHLDGTTTSYIATVKGAPETLKSMFVNIDASYDEVYLKHAQNGSRILALGWKEMGCLSAEQVKNLDRSDLECGLQFSGFLVISCCLKRRSKAVIHELLSSKHKVVMITGDNPFTACYVARKLLFTQKIGGVLMLKCMNEKPQEWFWENVNYEEELLPMKTFKICDTMTETYDLCVTGEGLTYLNEYHPEMIKSIVQYVSVFARVSPEQKEFVIVTLKSLGYVTLMCGDGTNDAGALKHADVGVTVTPFRQKQQEKSKEELKINESRGTMSLVKKIFRDKFMKILPKMKSTQGLKISDACLGALFNSQLDSIECVCHIIKQGRCTLVTTLQMLKILTLCGLILAYGLLILCLEGFTLRKKQFSLLLLFYMAVCFPLVFKLKPSKTIAPQRPLANLFNVYTMGTILSQFAVYVITLMFLVRQSLVYLDSRTFQSGNNYAEFGPPNVTNSAVCIVSFALNFIVLAINGYRGRPFLKTISEDKALLTVLLMASCVVVMFCFGIWPSFSKSFELIIEFDIKFQCIVLATLVAAFVSAYFCDMFFRWLVDDGINLSSDIP